MTVLRYTLLRLGLLFTAVIICYALGARGLLLLLLAFLMSGLASYVLLARQRDAMSEKIANTESEDGIVDPAERKPDGQDGARGGGADTSRA